MIITQIQKNPFDITQQTPTKFNKKNYKENENLTFHEELDILSQPPYTAGSKNYKSRKQIVL